VTTFTFYVDIAPLDYNVVSMTTKCGKIYNFSRDLGNALHPCMYPFSNYYYAVMAVPGNSKV
jgi:hypothetical protein